MDEREKRRGNGLEERGDLGIKYPAVRGVGVLRQRMGSFFFGRKDSREGLLSCELLRH
jgi:hypothetical protein